MSSGPPGRGAKDLEVEVDGRRYEVSVWAAAEWRRTGSGQLSVRAI